MSSARKRAYKHKAYAEIDHLKQQLMLKSYHYDSMLVINKALAKAGDDARAENAKLKAALKSAEYTLQGFSTDAWSHDLLNVVREALKETK